MFSGVISLNENDIPLCTWILNETHVCKVLFKSENKTMKLGEVTLNGKKNSL